MKRKGHLLITFVMAMFMVMFSFYMHGPDWWIVAKGLAFWWAFTMLPDADIILGFAHRHWFFHSIIPAVLITACLGEIPQTSFIIFLSGAHLLEDCWKPANGTWCVTWRKGKRWSMHDSLAWYLVNGVLGIVIAVGLEAA